MKKKLLVIIIAVFVTAFFAAIFSISYLAYQEKDVNIETYTNPTISTKLDNDNIYYIEINENTYKVNKNNVIVSYDYIKDFNTITLKVKTYKSGFNNKHTDLTMYLEIGLGGDIYAEE